MNDFLDGVIGLVISDLEWDYGVCLGVRAVMEEAIGEGTAEAFMEKEKQKRHFDALIGEAVGVVVPIALHQIMGLHLA